MAVYDRGDVVLVHFPWTNEDGIIESKVRPGLILRVEGPQERLIIQITSKNRSDHFPGKWILKDSDIGREMGLLTDSFIHYTQQAELHFRDIVRKIGFCRLIDEIEEYLENLDKS